MIKHYAHALFSASGKPPADEAENLRRVAYASLLDGLRAMPSKLSVPTVVVAAASETDELDEVVTELGEHAYHSGLRVALAELVARRGERLLRRRDLRDDEGEGSPAPIELSGVPSRESAGPWLEEVAKGRDLTLIVAPDLVASVDAALLARLGDGLLLVVKPMETAQETFEISIERVRSTGCQLLGMVMLGHRTWLPGFLRKLFESYPRTLSARPSKPPQP